MFMLRLSETNRKIDVSELENQFKNRNTLIDLIKSNISAVEVCCLYNISRWETYERWRLQQIVGSVAEQKPQYSDEAATLSSGLSHYELIHLSAFTSTRLLIQTSALLRHFLKRAIQDMCCSCKWSLFWQDPRTWGTGWWWWWWGGLIPGPTFQSLVVVFPGVKLSQKQTAFCSNGAPGHPNNCHFPFRFFFHKSGMVWIIVQSFICPAHVDQKALSNLTPPPAASLQQNNVLMSNQSWTAASCFTASAWKLFEQKLHKQFLERRGWCCEPMLIWKCACV